MMHKKKILYAFWGHLADRRVKDGKKISVPNGNATYSWCVIHEFQKRGYDVYRGMPDRDCEYVEKRKQFAFAAFSTKNRYEAYTHLFPVHFDDSWSAIEWPDVDVVLLEWRFPIIGRNREKDRQDPLYEPDLFIQNQILEHYTQKGTPIIAFDLDLQMTKEDEEKVSWVYELGFSRGPAHHVDPFFLMEDILQFPTLLPKKEIAYIGNRYNRDEQFDRYLGSPIEGYEIKVYGNWLEKGRDSKERWPHITFEERIHPEAMQAAYMHSSVVPLLLPEAYNQHGWMTFRLLESLLFGSIPVLPREFDSSIQYVPSLLRIDSQASLRRIASAFYNRPGQRDAQRKRICESLEFCDVSYFYEKIHQFV